MRVTTNDADVSAASGNVASCESEEKERKRIRDKTRNIYIYMTGRSLLGFHF